MTKLASAQLPNAEQTLPEQSVAKADRHAPLPNEHANVATYKRMIAAFNNNDLGIVQEVVAADLEYTLPGRSALAGVTHGVEAHLKMLKLARELTAGTLRLQPEALAVDGSYLFVWGTISATWQERRLECKHCVVYRFNDGKIVEGRTVPTDLYAFDEFFAR